MMDRASLKEISRHALKVIHRAAVFVLVQHRAKHAHGIGRIGLSLLLLTVEQVRQTVCIEPIFLLRLFRASPLRVELKSPAIRSQSFGPDELEVVQSVDLSRYVRRWYEISRLPNGFQKKCADMVTANYTMRPDGKIEVINRCRKASGEYATAKGKAKIVDKKTNAKLKVTFFWPFYGDYWILDLGPNYEYVSVPSTLRSTLKLSFVSN